MFCLMLPAALNVLTRKSYQLADIFLQLLQHDHFEYLIIYVILVLLKTGDSFVLCLFVITITKMSRESHNTRLGGMNQELHDFKNEFSTQLSDLSNSLNEKFDSLYKLLGESEGKIKANINDIVTESLMSVKDLMVI